MEGDSDQSIPSPSRPSRQGSGRPQALSAVEAATEVPVENSQCTRTSIMVETRDAVAVTSPFPASPSTKERKSAQFPARKATRPSEEFDRRYDGPFGRPSLTMTRKISASHARPILRGRPTTAELLDLEKAKREGEDTSTAPRPPFRPLPPSLNYTLRTRKLSILIFWTVIIFDSVVLPIALYFGLWYGVGPGTNTPTEVNEKLSANAVFSIVTAAIGGASILEYFLRFWRLYKKGSTCRVIGAHRWYLDWFHWNFSLAWIIIMFELIVGTVPRNPPIRLLSMPLTTMLYVFGTELLLVDMLRYFEVPAPVRMSSIPKGATLRPAIYTMIEDVCAVDGSGGTAFREALDQRYEASHIFRAMLRRLGIFWALGAEGMAVVCTVLIFTLDKDVAYAVGWSAPFVWAGVWTVFTFWYVKKELRREEKEWSEEAAMVESPMRI